MLTDDVNEVILNTDEKVILALRLATEWKAFKIFCKERTTCKGCPYCVNHICSVTCTEKILFKIADVAQEYLEKNNLR